MAKPMVAAFVATIAAVIAASPRADMSHLTRAAWRTADQTGLRPRTRKRPKELVGTSVRRVLKLRTSPQSLVVAGFLARLPCDLRTWFPGPSRGSLLEPVWRFNLPLRARRNVRAGPRPPQRACPRTCSDSAKSYPRTSTRCGRSVDTLHREVPHWSSARPPRGCPGWLGEATR